MDEWNDHLTKNEIGNIFNSTGYAEYAEKWLGWKPLFCRVIDQSGNISLQVLLFEYIPSIERFPNLFHGIIKNLRNTLRWNYGPISMSQESTSFFFSYISKKYKRVYGTTHPLSVLNYDYFKKISWSTFLIDLTKEKEELYKNMSKHNARKNIERAIERNVTVEEINDQTLNEYHILFNKHRLSMELSEVKKEELEDMWKSLRNFGFYGFIARNNGRVIGGLLFSAFNDYISEWGVARSEEDSKEKLYAQDLIKWKIIEWGIEHKMKWYDLSGVNPVPKTRKEEGILEYKKKWGGFQKNYWIISGGS